MKIPQQPNRPARQLAKLCAENKKLRSQLAEAEQKLRTTGRDNADMAIADAPGREHVAADRGMVEREERLRLHVENSPLAIVEWDKDFIVTLWAGEAEKMFGWKAAETIGKPIADLNMIFKEDIPVVNRTMERLTTGNEPTVVSSNRNYTRDGRVIYCVWYNSVLLDRHGMMSSVLSQVLDITERKHVEEALRTSEERFRALAENVPDLITRFDRNMRLVYTNPAVLRRTGLPGEALAGRTAHEYGTTPAAAARWESVAREVLDSGKPRRYEHTNAWQGEMQVLDVQVVPERDAEGHVQTVLAIARDITERKQAEEALRQSEERFKAITSSTPDHILVQDRDLKYTFVVNPQLGLTAQDMIGKTDYDFLRKDDAEKLAKLKRQVLETACTVNVELPLVSPQGESQFFSGSYVPKYDAKGQIDGLIGYFKNVSDRKKGEDDLRQSEERYRTLFETLLEGFCIVEMVFDEENKPVDYRFLETNPAFEKQTGLHEARGRLMRDLAPDNETHWFELYGKVAVTGKPIRFVNEAKALNRWYEVHAYRVGGTESRKVAILFNDITERRRKEEELKKANRTLLALSESSRALIHAVDEQKYLDQACRIVVKDCGHAMVWIGLAENDENKSIRPVAHAGFEEGYLETLKLSWADTERGRGPTGTAIRAGHIAVCRNMLTDPLFAPWRAEALKRGYASSIVFPLIAGGATFGAMTIYSREPDPFSAHEVQLLTRLANDLAFGVHAIRLRKAHARTEEALRESDRRFRLALRNAPVSIAAQDRNLRFIWAYNQRSVNPVDLIGKTDTDLFAPEDAERLISLKREVMETGKEKADSFWITSNGSRMFLDIFVEPVQDEKGEVSSIGIATVDLTGSKLAEQAIARARKEWERTFDAVPDLIAVMDKNHRIVRANKAMAERLHLTPGQCAGRLCYSSVHGANAPPAFCPHVLTMSDGREHVVEIHEECLGGDFIVSTTPMHDEDGNLVGSVHVARDITERKNAESTIRNQYSLLKSIIESPASPVFSVDTEYRYTSFNRSHSEVMNALYGVEIELGKSILDYHRVDQDRTGAKTTIDRVLKGEAFTLDTWAGAEGPSKRYFEISHSPVVDPQGRITGAAIFANDVTERKKSQRQIEHLASFPRLNPNPIMEMDKDGTITYCNEAALKRAAELGSEGDVRVLLPGDINEILGKARRADEALTFFRDVTVRGRTFEDSIQTLRDLHVVRVYCREITKRKQMEHALRRSAEEYRLLMEEAADGILMTDEKGTIVAVNARLCEMLGREKNEFFALTLQELMPEEDSARFPFSLEERTSPPPEAFDHRLKRKDGTLIHVQTNIKKLASGRIQSIVRDVTRQKEKEQKLMQAMQEEVFEKLFVKLRAFKHGQSGAMNLNRLALFADNFSAISKSLSSEPPARERDLLDRFGVAVEEFDTLVAPELEHISSLMMIAEVDTTLPAPADIRSIADTLLSSIEHLKERIDHAMSLAKDDRTGTFSQVYPSLQEDILGTISRIQLALSDVTAFIEANFTCLVSDIVRATMQKFETNTPTLRVQFDDETRRSRAIVNASELGAVLSILMENAIEALRLRPGDEPQARKCLQVRTETVGQTVRIVVEDNGPGVPQNIRERLFENGVSSKSPDRGFGLGYAKKCITRYGGRIFCDASVKSGARFVIEIPKA